MKCSLLQYLSILHHHDCFLDKILTTLVLTNQVNQVMFQLNQPVVAGVGDRGVQY